MADAEIRALFLPWLRLKASHDQLFAPFRDRDTNYRPGVPGGLRVAGAAGNVARGLSRFFQIIRHVAQKWPRFWENDMRKK
jgi:hypothetical protein